MVESAKKGAKKSTDQAKAKAVASQITGNLKTSGGGVIPPKQAIQIINGMLGQDRQLPVDGQKLKDNAGKMEIQKALIDGITNGTYTDKDINAMVKALNEKFQNLNISTTDTINLDTTRDQTNALEEEKKGGKPENFDQISYSTITSGQSDKSAGSKTSSGKSTKGYAKSDLSGFDKKRFFDRAMQLADDHKFNLFPNTKQVMGQNISNKSSKIQQAFKDDISNIQDQAHQHTNLKRTQQFGVVVRTYIKEEAKTQKQASKMEALELPTHVQLDVLKYQDALESKNISQIEDQIHSLQTQKQMALDPNTPDPKKKEQEQAYEQLESRAIALENRLIQLRNQESGTIGGSGVQNALPAQKVAQASVPHQPPKPKTKEEAYQGIKKALSERGRPLEVQKQLLKSVVEATKSDRQQQLINNADKPAPNGVGGDAVNAIGQDNRNTAEVPLGTSKADFNEFVNNPIVQNLLIEIGKQKELTDAQQILLENQALNIQILQENIDAMKNEQAIKDANQKALYDSGMAQIIKNARRNGNPKNPIPNDPKKIILVSSSMEQGPIVPQSAKQQKLERARAEYEKQNQRPTIDAKYREIAEKQASTRGEILPQLTITLYDYVNYMFKAANFISKIEGDIQLGQPLSAYKTQTSIFTPKIKKLESNEFKIMPNSAFKLRACC